MSAEHDAPAGPEPAMREIDARSLKAIAHPLRVRILQFLGDHGPATSALLSERLSESTGTLSWHLRQLAEHGFIEEDEDRGTKRERWWRQADTALNLPYSRLRRDPALRAPLAAYVDELQRENYERVLEFQHSDFPEAWTRAGGSINDSGAWMTPEQLEALHEELLAVTLRHSRAAPKEPTEGMLPVRVQIQVFPYRPETGGDGGGEAAAR